MGGTRFRRARVLALPMVVLIIGALATFALLQYRRSKSAEEARRSFEGTTLGPSQRIVDQFERMADVLRSATTFATAGPTFDRTAFAAFGQAVDLPSRYPGLRSIDYVARVPAADLAAFVEAQRSAQPTFALQPPGARPDYMVVAASTPGPAATGLDLGTFGPAREAMLEAGRTATPVVSRRVDLPQPDGHLSPSVAMFAPVYRGGAPPLAPAARDAALIGWTATTVPTADLVANLAKDVPASIGVDVYDGPVTTPGALVGTVGPPASDGSQRHLTHDSPQPVYGREWTLHFRALRGFSTASARLEELGVAVAGAFATLAVAGLALARERGRSELAERAEAAVSELRRVETRFRSAFHDAPIGMGLLSPDGRLLSANRVLCELLGRREARILGKPPSAFCHPDDAAAVVALLGSIAAGAPEAGHREYRLLHADGYPVWARISAAALHGASGRPASVIVHVEDVTARRAAAMAVEESETRFAALVERGSDIITVVDAEGRIGYASPAVERLLGWPVTDLIGTQVLELIHPDDRDRARFRLGETMHTPGPTDAIRLLVAHANGSWRQLETVATNVLDDPAVGGIVLNARDITDRTEATNRLAWQAFHDHLTGLPNRTLLLDRLDQALRRSTRDGTDVGVLFLDLDRFKVVNDSLGHDAGDQLLKQVATRLEGAMRVGDTVARLGGDEFVVLVDGVNGLAEAEQIAARVLETVTQPMFLRGGELTVTTSIGLAMATGQEPEALLRDADTALYRAKDDGKDGIAVFDEVLRAMAVKRLDIERVLRRAHEEHRLNLYYQPVVDLRTGTIQGVEALLRLDNGSGGLLLPDDFIGVAEESGLIVPIGAEVIKEACRQAGEWASVLGSFAPHKVSVNVSARQLVAPGVVAEVAAAIADAGARPGALWLELTEGMLIDAGTTALQTLSDLRAIGVSLGVDDFGTGYSSLAYLKRFPLDFIKVDRSFVDGLGTDADDTEIVRATIGLGQALGLTTVAEGVETPEQLVALRDLGCDLAQGFYFAKPQRPEELVELLAADPRW